jgi:hypothetical protein
MQVFPNKIILLIVVSPWAFYNACVPKQNYIATSCFPMSVLQCMCSQAKLYCYFLFPHECSTMYVFPSKIILLLLVSPWVFHNACVPKQNYIATSCFPMSVLQCMCSQAKLYYHFLFPHECSTMHVFASTAVALPEERTLPPVHCEEATGTSGWSQHKHTVPVPPRPCLSTSSHRRRCHRRQELYRGGHKDVQWLLHLVNRRQRPHAVRDRFRGSPTWLREGSGVTGDSHCTTNGVNSCNSDATMKMISRGCWLWSAMCVMCWLINIHTDYIEASCCVKIKILPIVPSSHKK